MPRKGKDRRGRGGGAAAMLPRPLLFELPIKLGLLLSGPLLLPPPPARLLFSGRFLACWPVGNDDPPSLQSPEPATIVRILLTAGADADGWPLAPLPLAACA